MRTSACSNLSLAVPFSASVTLGSSWTLSTDTPEGRCEHQIGCYCKTPCMLPLPQGYCIKVITCSSPSCKNIFLQPGKHRRYLWHQNILVLEVPNRYLMVRNSLTIPSVSRHCSSSKESQKGTECRT